MSSGEMKTPKQIYMEKVQALQDPNFQEQLTNLYEFGFVQFEINKGLILKYKDMETVINILLSGALNESAIDALYKEGGEEE